MNKNIKNNIKKRELDEDILLLSDEDSRKSDVEEDGIIKNKVEISPGYIIESEMATI